MPLYEYACKNCGEKFEELRSLNDADRSNACPKCGSKSARRVMSTFATGSSKTDVGEGPTCSTGVCNLPR